MSVTVTNPPELYCLVKNGTIEPVEPTTFPYLATVKTDELHEDASGCHKRSIDILVAPYRFIGQTALSVLMATIRLTPATHAALATFREPRTLVSIHSDTLHSADGICLYAAACITRLRPCISSDIQLT